MNELHKKNTENLNVICSEILIVKPRIQRKKIQAEICRLNDLLLYSKCDKDERIYIKQVIDKLQNEMGVFK